MEHFFFELTKDINIGYLSRKLHISSLNAQKDPFVSFWLYYNVEIKYYTYLLVCKEV